MPIERPLYDPPLSNDDFFVDPQDVSEDYDSMEFEEIGDDEEVEVVELEDGGVLIEFDPAALEDSVPFDSNLAEEMEDSDLQALAGSLVGQYLGDKSSRKEWEDTYTKGLDQLGMKIEERTEPWDGACGVNHPILSEAVVRFQSQTIGEIFPSEGPVKSKIIGKSDPDKLKQANRIKDFMNYLVTEVMDDYRPETERLLFSLPLSGSAFRKIYWDADLNRPAAMFVPSEDLVVSYGASSLRSSERITHVMKRAKNDVRKQQVAGFYRDVDISTSPEEASEIQAKQDEITGEEPSYEVDSRVTLLEIQADLDLVGFEDKDHDGEDTGVALPYVVTIEKSSNKVLSIYRNWEEGDVSKSRLEHFVHYEYIPGFGFYGFGLIHMVGGIAKSATSILRQLVDAGTLSNLPGGVKTRGLRISGDDTPVSPGEFRDVDVPGGKIQDNIMFLPYKEPSSTLLTLLGSIVEEGRRFASLTDLNISDMSQQAPVGTTLALLERSMKVQSAVQARLHAAMKREFKILHRLVRDYAPYQYPYDLGGDEVMRIDDFDDRIDVVPVSDPGSATMAQRIMQIQAAHQMSASAPHLYDQALLHRRTVEILGLEDADKLVPTEDDVYPMDPVSENMKIMTGEPVKAFLWQDHEAHITAHTSLMQDPRMMELASMAPDQGAAGQAIMASHIAEHAAFQYRVEIEKELGVPLPPPDEVLPDDVETQLSALVAQASARVAQRAQQEQQQMENQEQAADPIIQMRQAEVEIAKLDAESRANERSERIKLDREKAQERNAVERERIEANRQNTKDKVAGDIETTTIRVEEDEKERESKELAEGTKMGIELAKDARKIQRGEL